MVEWLIAKRKDDVRYSLAKTLHDAKIQDRFDIILIDAPPRLTTGSVQAFCAATHVLVPTILDGMSAEATGGFVEQLATNNALWPHIKLLGAFGNMTEMLVADFDGAVIDGRLRQFEADALTSVGDTIQAALEKAGPSLRAFREQPVFPEECFIPNKVEPGNQAGSRIAYQVAGGSLPTQQISRAFDRLGDEIDRRILATTKG